MVQLNALTDSYLFNQIKSYFVIHSSTNQPSSINDGLMNEKHLGLSVSDAAALLRVSMIIAKEILLQAEKCTLLCRDESLSGLAFYYNHFSDF